MRRRRAFFDLAPDEEEISLTPLIDVVFVVLILFILVAPMVEIDQIQLASAPQRETLSAASPGPLTIHVLGDDTIQINQRAVAPGQVRPLLRALRQTQPDATPQLFQDQAARFGTYQLIKNAAEEAGYSQLEVVLAPHS